MSDVLLLILIGVLAGMVAGMLGVGGGILFVPGLVLVLGLGQVEAQATSLVAIIPVSALGAWRQHRYGNVRWGDAAVMGALSIGGVVAGVALANALDEGALRVGFALVVLYAAFRLVRPPRA